MTTFVNGLVYFWGLHPPSPSPSRKQWPKRCLDEAVADAGPHGTHAQDIVGAAVCLEMRFVGFAAYLGCLKGCSTNHTNATIEKHAHTKCMPNLSMTCQCLASAFSCSWGCQEPPRYSLYRQQLFIRTACEQSFSFLHSNKNGTANPWFQVLQQQTKVLFQQCGVCHRSTMVGTLQNHSCIPTDHAASRNTHCH